MVRVVEANLFLIAGLIMVLSFCKSSEAVVSFLIAVAFTELSVCIEDNRLQIGLCVGFIITCLFIYNIIFYLPVMIYANTWNNKWKRNAMAIIIVILFYYKLSPYVIGGLIVCTLFAFFIAYEARNAKEASDRTLEAIDTAKIMENRLKSKNRELLESQDATVHVAMLQERNRIAREIHDNVGHMLSRTILQMGALMTIYKDEPLNGQLQSVSDTLNEAMNNIRESVHDLHDESIDLRQAIYEAVSDMKKDYTVKVDYDMSNDIPRAVKYCFISIVKEAMSNIVKHSNANSVVVIVREHPGFYQMAIEDNGTENKKNKEAGIGLSNMTDRVEGLSGTIHISNENGFKILISIPKS